MSDANIAINYDFNALLAAHQASGADVTVAYQKTEIPEGRKTVSYTHLAKRRSSLRASPPSHRSILPALSRRTP